LIGRTGQARPAVFALALAIGCLIVAAAPALACSAPAPSFEQAVLRSEAVARVTVLDAAEGGAGPETYRVDRILKGVLPPIVTLDDSVAGFCSGPIGGVAGEGTVVIVAFRMPFDNAMVDPIWFDTAEGLASTAQTPEELRTLADVEERIRGLVPAAPGGPSPMVDLSGLVPVALLLAAGLIGVLAILRPGRGQTD
jgi:hypothetical protein